MERIEPRDHNRRCDGCGKYAQWTHEGRDYCIRNECQLVASEYGRISRMEKLSTEQVAKIFGVTKEEIEDDNGYAVARAEAKAQEDAFISTLRAELLKPPE